ncbi:hypothetical protein THAOC_20102 [Thalassiosira oceanica]|uniref:Uncharacterized protein n=1 Tax=Thalassiosira oceanica TaxID=159749 RepID=K0S0R3_THAOC|nr:hypothetical protein THAOC_20102 [Thalassiosira oceanica]|eukprot:EJK59638.1 hypothetical protein THAOC_20102 [Thalassiosira oceanica]
MGRELLDGTMDFALLPESPVALAFIVNDIYFDAFRTPELFTSLPLRTSRRGGNNNTAPDIFCLGKGIARGTYPLTLPRSSCATSNGTMLKANTSVSWDLQRLPGRRHCLSNVFVDAVVVADCESAALAPSAAALLTMAMWRSLFDCFFTTEVNAGFEAADLPTHLMSFSNDFSLHYIVVPLRQCLKLDSP